MKKIIYILLLLSFSTGTLASDKNGKYTLRGYLSNSCSQYLDAAYQARNYNNWGDWNQYYTASYGYFTAYNWLSEDTYSILGSVSMDGAMDRLENICKTNPIEPFGGALQHFTSQQHPYRKKAL